jgi:MFS family permease
MSPKLQPAAASPSLALLLGIVTGVQTLATFALIALSTLAPKVAETLGVAPQWIGYQISLTYVAATIVSLVSGAGVRRLGAAGASIVALVIWAASFWALASASLAVVVIASLALGAGYGLTNPAASHLLFRFGPARRRNLVFALKQTGVPLGGALAGLLLPPLAERVGWQWAIALSALLFLALCLPLAAVRRRWDDDRAPGARLKGDLFEGMRIVAAHGRLLAIAVMGLFYAGIQMVLMSFAVTMLVAEQGWTLVAAGAAASVMQLGVAFGRLGWAWVADRLVSGRIVLALIGILGFVLCLLLSRMQPAWPAWLAGGLLAALGATTSGWNGVYMAEVARESPPGSVGPATGASLAFSFAGAMLAPAAFAALLPLAGSYATAVLWVSGLPLLGALAVVLGRRAAAPKGEPAATNRAEARQP